MLVAATLLLIVRSAFSAAALASRLSLDYDSDERFDESSIAATINATISALGGYEVLQSINTFTYHADRYRFQLLTYVEVY